MSHSLSKRLPAVLALLILAALLSFSVAPRAAAAPDAPVHFRCQPATYMGSTADLAVIDLYAENAAGMYGLDVRLSFDPTIAHVVDADAFAPGVQIAPLYSWFVPGSIAQNYACNTASPGDCASAGVLRYAATQYYPQPPIPPSNPAGPFARITFQPQADGAFTMNFLFTQVSDVNGSEIPSDAASCAVQFLQPTAVHLAHQSAEVAGRTVRLAWATATEQDILGFNVYRASAPAGPWTQLNDALLLAHSPGLPGAHDYAWTDTPPATLAEAWYLLESISPAGTAVRAEPLAAPLAAPNTVHLSAFAARRPPSAALPLLLFLPVAAAVAFRRCR